MPNRAPRCPWAAYPTHRRNGQLQVSAARPIMYGQCGHLTTCSSCAGTLYKPNVHLPATGGFVFVPCPHCEPAAYRGVVPALVQKMPFGHNNTRDDGAAPPGPPKDSDAATSQRTRK